MTRKTKVRIVGEPELACKIAECIKAHFEFNTLQHFKSAPVRYAKNQEPLHSYYFDIKKSKETEFQQALKIFYGKLMDFENRLIADCGQGKSFEAGEYAGVVANLRKDIEVLLSKEVSA